MLEILPIDELCKFLVNAKTNTFAKDVERVQSKCILSKNYLYEEDDFRYEDQYFGEYLDVGEEIVWKNGIPVWGMGYRGGMLEAYRSLNKETFSVLRKALLIPEKDFPTRGPKQMICGDFKYVNITHGDIKSFTGEEYIEKNGNKIYFRNYIGGLIYGKNNINMKVI